MKKIKLLKKITGDVPTFYRTSTIYNMCVTINALVDIVNELNKRVEILLQDHPTEKGDKDNEG